MTGFSAVIGSWNTMAMRSPRSARQAARPCPTSSRPSKRMLPDTRPGAGTRPISASAVMLLPHPLSPTTPRVRPDGML